MSRLHICNTFFESELESETTRPLRAWMESHAIVKKLQLLPICYAEPSDLILVSELPENPDPRLLLEGKKGMEIESWGPSLAIKDWADAHGLLYDMPPWGLVKEINSKIFSFTHSPHLKGAALLESARDVHLWMEKTAGPKVLKSAFGTAGKGHFHVGKSPNLTAFLEKQFRMNIPIIGEPWVNRTLDFSTQWKNGECLGPTLFESDAYGSYRATKVGPNVFKGFEWALEEHLRIAKPLVEKIQTMGYFGHLGIDAFVYDEKKLQPIVEINARKTMSYAALMMQRKNPQKTLRFSFSPKTSFSVSIER